MTKLNISKSDPVFLSFDGEILECFFEDGSKRIHVAFIQGIELGPNQKGKRMLTFKLNRAPIFLWADEDVVEQVNALIAEIQKAKASFKP